ncbi:peptidyl-prolyl cis-trans isomerase [bacterium]|nr:peptidyl-prolyl cis-trans isomerase [bacterium]
MKSYRVAHILVSAKHEAEDILRKLIAKPEEFESMARKYSSCSSAPDGGDLGEVKIGKADPDFEDAALALKAGEISKQPVRTRFGYHLIKRL